MTVFLAAYFEALGCLSETDRWEPEWEVIRVGETPSRFGRNVVISGRRGGNLRNTLTTPTQTTSSFNVYDSLVLEPPR